ncbi:MAG: TPM domain-containing protein [Candidatus Omnitrophica bacterium]|nr:TPM domain-containing protein [Candidatus Omnitrophota bacterium]MBU1133529.1 TPM domain-containing protein [Candidatus Omnitrophota bacterium]MBU1366187.1 TPM domain-containing protein [Candidatus Omnitrophota bacterium]MBU1524500.1 TPM domain-containing protein [Candidatus Omnitrophota bacterium]MBU1810067.1 TPM domain-containing protein [Candidatus Omnitrophota bacterium]
MKTTRAALLVFSILAAVSGNLYAQEKFPKPSGYVNDFVGILPPQERVKLENLLSELERKTTAQVSVVSLETTKPLDIETYAVKLFENWGIGQKGKDNGVLLLVASEDKKVRIEVGYGLEGAIPDALAQQIIAQVIVPLFKQGNFPQGIMKGALGIAGLVAKEYNVQLAGFKDLPQAPVVRKSSSSAGILRLVLLFILIFGFRFGFLWWPLLFAGSYRRRGGSWYGSGYGGNSGGFSGGFGGGFSGGGGASGGW